MNHFEQTPLKIPSKNVFNLSHDVKGTFKFDYLYPFLCQEVYPGSTFNCRSELFVRSMPLITPILHHVDAKLYFFFVPNRLIWKGTKDIVSRANGEVRTERDSWQTFITGGELGVADVTPPYFTFQHIGAFNLGIPIQDSSLMDYLGYPTIHGASSTATNPTPISSLPLRAYQLIWNEYFRNQNLQQPFDIPQSSGEEDYNTMLKLCTLRKKCWEKDYFTSCLPFLQRGQAVRIPISAELNLDADHMHPNGAGSSAFMVHNPRENQWDPVEATQGIKVAQDGSLSGDTQEGTVINNTIVDVDLKGTINDLRESYRLQRWLENNARCGSRYIEQLFAHFGVVSSDARLQRPELLGGGNIPLVISDIEQTSATEEGSTPQANLAGKGTAYGKTNGFKKYFEEHGWIIGILCMLPRTSYQNQVPRSFSRMSRFDYYFPEFANLGEQAVLNKEVFFDPTDKNGGDDGTFGYQERFGELRYIPSSVHGEFKHTLQYWHLGRVFKTLPQLNEDFVQANSRNDIFAIDSTIDPFVFEMHLDIKAVLPLPKFAIPTL